VLVSVTGYAGYQGGLDQALSGYPGLEVDELEIDGDEARPSVPAMVDELTGERLVWGDLVVAREPDLAVRITSPDATREQLLDMAGRVEERGRLVPPFVADPPEGMVVAGWAGTGAVVAFEPWAAPGTDAVPATATTHAAAWVDSEVLGSFLVVTTIDAGVVDLAAVPWFHHRWAPWWTEPIHRERQIGDQGAVVLEGFRQGDPSMPDLVPDEHHRSVWLASDFGDVVVVAAKGPRVPSEDELVAIASSVEPTDDAGWESFIVEMTGGPGLRPDPSRHELARGQEGDVEWLLQDGPPPGGDVHPEYGMGGVDPCLKLSTRRRACAGAGGGGGSETHYFTDGDEGLSCVVVSTALEGASIRVTTATEEVVAPLVEVPAGGVWAGLAFVDDPGTPACGDVPEPPPHMTLIRIDVLNAAGEPIGCLGLGPDAYNPYD
jgi:hypothetical protein